MGIAMLGFFSLFQGFSFLQRLTSAHPQDVSPRAARGLRMVRPSGIRPQVGARPVSPVCAPRPAALRVVRVCDAQQAPGELGRMRISGRMADVCAELDRLAEREAAMGRH